MYWVNIAYTQEVVTYDFDKGKFDKVIPFDELITFRFKNMPYDKFTFTCQELANNKGDIKTFDATDKNQENPNFLFRSEIKTKGDSASWVSKTYFKPNTDYVFSIVDEMSKRPLEPEEKQKFTRILVNEGAINDFLKGIDAILVSNDEKNEKTKRFNYAYEQLVFEIQEISKELSSENLTYHIDRSSSHSNLDVIKELIDAKTNLIEEIKITPSLYKSSEGTDLSDENLSTLNGLKKDLLNNIKISSTDNDLFLIEEQKNKLPKIVQDNLDTDWKKFEKLFARNIGSAFAEKVVDGILSDEVRVYEFVGSTIEKALVEQSKNFFAVDVGGAYDFRLNQPLFFTHISFYFRPVKRAVPLHMYKGWDRLWVSLSVDIGMTLNPISRTDEIQGFAFNNDNDTNKGLLLGLGFRVLPFAKINVGTTIYRENDINPLITNYSYVAGFYVGASIDLSVSSVFKENFSRTP
jgi:hypothetical protein